MTLTDNRKPTPPFSHLRFQKGLVFVNGCAADVANPCQLADIQLLTLVCEAVAEKRCGNVLTAHLRSHDLRFPLQNPLVSYSQAAQFMLYCYQTDRKRKDHEDKETPYDLNTYLDLRCAGRMVLCDPCMAVWAADPRVRYGSRIGR